MEGRGALLLDRLVNAALSGDHRSIARLISLVESESPLADGVMRSIYPRTGRAHVVGVTGSPGAGKSTLVDKMIQHFLDMGRSVGVIAVDPSSPFSGGAILGDRLRMQNHAVDSRVFIRSMGSRGSLGGVSGATGEAALILDACGKDVVIIETVGVGQSEVDIVKLADTVCLVLVPGMGDDVQIMKAGIMEIADVFVVNKADRDGADKVVADIRMMLDISFRGTWRPPVVKTCAERGDGVDDAVKSVMSHREHVLNSQEGKMRRLSRIEAMVEGVLRKEISALVQREWSKRRDEGLLEDLLLRRADPYSTAESILDDVLCSK
ncbi:MAG: methylmalonyl Co-A mutase-associated GTPase MeaB [Thermanaerothrix sp.]|nr:methylmalonyl Co-A mutase-associated GTPase MeaB [Thermanaerothrix sp.]